MNKTSKFCIKTGPRLFVFPSTPGSTMARLAQLPIVFRPSFLPSHPTLEGPTNTINVPCPYPYPCAKPMLSSLLPNFSQCF